MHVMIFQGKRESKGAELLGSTERGRLPSRTSEKDGLGKHVGKLQIAANTSQS
jgi:hypothetical protein